MDSLRFDSFTRKIYIRSTLEKMYYCWGTEAGICDWFLRSASYTTKSLHRRSPKSFVVAGDNYIWEWHNWDGQESGHILEANGRDHMVFSFAGNTRVTVDLQPKSEKVLLSLTQSDIPTDEASKMNIYMGCSNGWTFWLASLKAYLEHGIRLNEIEEDITKIHLAGFI